RRHFRVVLRHHDVVFGADVMVHTNIPPVGIEKARWCSLMRFVITEDPRTIREWYLAEPLRRQRVHDPRITGTYDVWCMAITTHELVARNITGAQRQAGILRASGIRIVDRERP